ncbi:dTDP-4-dehydrorhamnose reductase [Mycetohabitans rhizoxinica]|jgi:dTDP-4-dehydrorhamnose reductase|uniref:dTDP-4-dehydrorhamnose reductase n=1 Tax=Mycetohabitans rhizoxinica TaxID=412963 RepID=A0ABZ2PVF7_9BURK
MKIVVTGTTGQLGWELVQTLGTIGDVVTLDRAIVDLAVCPAKVAHVIARLTPDIVINAAAYTAVDCAEQEEALANRVNAEAVEAMADAARRVGALLIHYSSDYVFDGSKLDGYVEDDQVNPLNAYGRSKLLGERAVMQSAGDWLIFRTSWVFAARGRNFLRTMLGLGGRHTTLRVVADQFGAPTSARFLATATAFAVHQCIRERQAGRFESGLFHLSAQGRASWHQFAAEIFTQARAMLPALPLRVGEVQAVSSSEYATAAKRPSNSVLSNEKFDRRFGLHRPDWTDGVRLALQEIAEAESMLLDFCRSTSVQA